MRHVSLCSLTYFCSRLLVGTLLAPGIRWAFGQNQGETFPGQQIIVFGTSLSDDGNGIGPYIQQTLNTDVPWPPPLFFNQMWSNGITWPDYLGYGINIEVLDYAMGSSAIAPYPWSKLANSFLGIEKNCYPPLPSAAPGSEWTIPVPTLFDQVNQYIVGGVYPSSKFLNSSRQRSVQTIPHQNVYIIEFGGNDLLVFGKNLLRIYLEGSGSQQEREAYVLAQIRAGQVLDFTKPLVEGVEEAMDRLYAAGGRRFVLWLMVPPTLTPRAVNLLRDLNPIVRVLGTAAANLIVGEVNKGYERIRKDFPASHPGSVVAIFDTPQAYQEIQDNKASYGLTDVTSACYMSDFSTCKPGKSCDNPQEHMFWDEVHPTTTTHQIIARKLQPGVVELLRQGKEAGFGAG